MSGRLGSALLTAVALAVLSGCGGEDKTKASKPERAATADWRATADGACARATDALVSRGWATDLRQMRRRLPGVVRDIRAAIDETQQLSGRPDQQFVAAMKALEPRFSEVLRASRTMNVRRLDRAITRLEAALRTVAVSARRAGLRECVQHDQARSIVNVLRAPVAVEQLVRIITATHPRLQAANDEPAPLGTRHYIAILADREDAVRALRVPAWAKRERAACLAAMRRYRLGLDKVADRYEAGLSTSHAQFVQLADRHAHATTRTLAKLWNGMGARPISKFP